MNENLKKEMQDKLENFANNNKYEMPLNEWKKGFDEIMDGYAKTGVLYNYYVKCDDENNLYLAQDIKVVDVYVEPTKGEGIFVNQITILKTSDTNSGT